MKAFLCLVVIYLAFFVVRYNPTNLHKIYLIRKDFSTVFEMTMKSTGNDINFVIFEGL